jgi:hypothetical protein
MFKYFGVKDLKNIRLVCRLWCELSSPFLQETAAVKLDENIHLEAQNMMRFYEKFKNVPREEVFYHNYKLSLWNIDERHPNLVKFWEKFGPTMHFLEISWARFVSVKTVRNVLFHWTPNLRSLTLKDCSFYDCPDEKELKTLRVAVRVPTHQDAEEIKVNRNVVSLNFFGGEPHTIPPISWEEIFMSFPNLKV